jgi:hypothetical protein
MHYNTKRSVRRVGKTDSTEYSTEKAVGACMEGTGKMLTHNCTVEVEEAPGIAAVEVLTMPFPLRNIDGTSTYISSPA